MAPISLPSAMSGMPPPSGEAPRSASVRISRPPCSTEKRGQEFSSSDVACHVTLRVGVIHAIERLYHASIARPAGKFHFVPPSRFTSLDHLVGASKHRKRK